MPEPPNLLAMPFAHRQSSADAAAEVADLRSELEHAQRLATLGTLAAGIAHEINNILTPVLAYAQLASSHPDDQALQIKAIAKAMVGVQAATEITQAMLGFASNPEESNHACVAEVFAASLDTIGRDPNKDRISIRSDIPSDLVVTIRPLALQQVLMNLLLNAWNALRAQSRAKGGSIVVSAIERSDGSALIRIVDDGPGIPPAVVGRLFEPFASSRKRSRFESTAVDATERTTSQSSGTGLGLVVCRRLIEAAGGTISAGSNPDRGAVFNITLPMSAKARAKAS